MQDNTDLYLIRFCCCWTIYMPTSKFIKLTILSLIFLFIQTTAIDSQVNQKTTDQNPKNNKDGDITHLKRKAKILKDSQIQAPKQSKVKSASRKKHHLSPQRSKQKVLNHPRQINELKLDNSNLQFQKPQQELKVKEAIVYQPDIKQYIAAKSNQLYPQPTFERTKTPDSFIQKNIQNDLKENKVPVLQKDQKSINELKEKPKKHQQKVDAQKLNKAIQQENNNQIENESDGEYTSSDQISDSSQPTAQTQKMNKKQTKQQINEQQEIIKQENLNQQYQKRLSAFNKPRDEQLDQEQKLQQKIAENKKKLQESINKVIEQRKKMEQQKNKKETQNNPLNQYDHQQRIIDQQKAKEKQLQAAQQSKKIADQTPLPTEKSPSVQGKKEQLKNHPQNTKENNNQEINKLRLEEKKKQKLHEKSMSGMNKAREEEYNRKKPIFQQKQKEKQQKALQDAEKEAQEKQLLEYQKKRDQYMQKMSSMNKGRDEKYDQQQKLIQQQNEKEKQLKVEEHKNALSAAQLQGLISTRYDRFESQYKQKIGALQTQVEKQHKINSELNKQYQQLLSKLNDKEKAEKNLQTDIIQFKKQFAQLVNEFNQYKGKNEQRLDKMTASKPATITTNDQHTVFITNDNLKQEQKKPQAKDNAQVAQKPQKPRKKAKMLAQEDPDLDLLNKVIQTRKKKQEQARKRMEAAKQAKKQIINESSLPQTAKTTLSGSDDNDFWFYAAFIVIVIAILYLKRKSNPNAPAKVTFYQSVHHMESSAPEEQS